MEEKEYTGWKVWTPTIDEVVDLYQEGKCPLDLKENEYLIVLDPNDGTVNATYKKKNGQLEKVNRAPIKIKDPKDGRVNKVYNPRNPEQVCAFDLLHDDDVTVKLITGPWGAGKDVMTTTAALEALREKRCEKIVWIRNNVDLKDTKDIGALKGTADEKLFPYLGPFIDHVGDHMKIERMMNDGQLEIQPLQFLRGRDIQNAIIICSEAENLTKEQIALIISRAAEGTKIFFNGDTRQRDKTAFEKSKGLETMIKKLAGDPLFGYVNLIKTERSATAALADKIIN